MRAPGGRSGTGAALVGALIGARRGGGTKLGEIHVGGDDVRHAVEPRVEIGGFPGLDEPEVAFGQGEDLRARQAAEDRQPTRLYSVADEPVVAIAADPVQDHAGDPDAGS